MAHSTWLPAAEGLDVISAEMIFSESALRNDLVQQQLPSQMWCCIYGALKNNASVILFQNYSFKNVVKTELGF